MGAVFSIFAGFYYWIPKISGFSYLDFYGKIHFFTFFIGANLTFFPMHFLGFSGMPRRIPDYPDFFYKWNSLASLGSFISFFSVIYFFFIVYNLIVYKRLSGVCYWFNFINHSVNFIFLFLLGNNSKFKVIDRESVKLRSWINFKFGTFYKWMWRDTRFYNSMKISDYKIFNIKE